MNATAACHTATQYELWHGDLSLSRSVCSVRIDGRQEGDAAAARAEAEAARREAGSLRAELASAEGRLAEALAAREDAAAHAANVARRPFAPNAPEP